MRASTSQRIGAHLRANVVGYVALFAALTLTPALAATEKAAKNSVVSKSIKDGQVKTPDLAGAAVTEAKLGFDTATETELATVSNSLAAAGTINNPTNPVNWTALKNVPAGLADGADDSGAGGTVTSVGSGAGLTGGPITTAGTLSLTPCPAGQLLKSNGAGAYNCAPDIDTDTNSGGDITAVTAGDALSGGGTTGDVALGLTPCGLFETLKYGGAFGWGCGPDNFARSVTETSDPTPSVGIGITLLKVDYSGATQITDLVDSDGGQEVTVLAVDNNVQITDGGNFQLAGNWLPDADDTLTVIDAGTKWVEVARSAN